MHTKDELTFFTALSEQSDEGCTPPNCWNDSTPVLYYSFDSSDGFILVEGTQQIGVVPLVEGKVRYIRLCFDNSDGFVLMDGSEQMASVSLLAFVFTTAHVVTVYNLICLCRFHSSFTSFCSLFYLLLTYTIRYPPASNFVNFFKIILRCGVSTSGTAHKTPNLFHYCSKKYNSYFLGIILLTKLNLWTNCMSHK